MNNPTIIREDEERDLRRPSVGVEDSKAALSDNPVNRIMDRLGPTIVFISILTLAFLGFLEASGSGFIESIIGPGFGLHGHGVLVYVMSIFAYGCIGGIIGLIAALLVNAVLSVVVALGS